MRMPPHRLLVQIAKKKLLRKKSARSTAAARTAITAKERLVEELKNRQDGAKQHAG
jgi:hypothetical protein